MIGEAHPAEASGLQSAYAVFVHALCFCADAAVSVAELCYCERPGHGCLNVEKSVFPYLHAALCLHIFGFGGAGADGFDVFHAFGLIADVPVCGVVHELCAARAVFVLLAGLRFVVPVSAGAAALYLVSGHAIFFLRGCAVFFAARSLMVCAATSAPMARAVRSR